MIVHEITTISGSEYVVEEHPDGRFLFTATKAEGKGARFVGKQYGILAPMPWPLELDIPMWVTAHPDTVGFPAPSNYLRTSPVRSYATTQVDEAGESHA